MLKPNKRNLKSRQTAAGFRFAIVASKYNHRYVNGMLQAALAELKKAGADTVEVIRVPGSFEIPIVAAKLAHQEFDAVICLGLILQGETTHADHIAQAVSRALMRLQLDTGVPMIHEVLQLRSREQAQVRCLNPETNRGTEAARSAIEMAQVMGNLEAKRRTKG